MMACVVAVVLIATQSVFIVNLDGDEEIKQYLNLSNHIYITFSFRIQIIKKELP